MATTPSKKTEQTKKAKQTKPATMAGTAPRLRRPRERPGELLAAALAVFQTHGYEASSLDDVAVAAGVTKGAIYHHFRNKEELLDQAIRERLEKNFEELRTLVDGATATPEERIRTVLRFASARWGTPDFARFLALLGEVGREHPELVRLWVAQGPSVGAEILADLVREGQATGDFEPALDAASAAWFLLSGVTLGALAGTAGGPARTPRSRRGARAAAPLDLVDQACALIRRPAGERGAPAE